MAANKKADKRAKNKTKNKSKNKSNKDTAELKGYQMSFDTNADPAVSASKKRIKDEITAVIIIAVGLFMAISFHTNATGEFGRILGEFFKGMVGFTAYILPYYVILVGVLLFTKKMVRMSIKTCVLNIVIYFMLVFINAGRFINSHAIDLSMRAVQVYYNNGIALDDGGVIGMYVGGFIVKLIGIAGLYILTFVVILICLLLVLNTPISRMLEDAKIKKSQIEEARAKRIAEKERIKEEKRQQMEVEMMLQQDKLERKAKERDAKFFETKFDENDNFTKQPSNYDNLSENQKRIMEYVEQEQNPWDSQYSNSEFGQSIDQMEGYPVAEIDTDNPYGFEEGGYWNTGDDENIIIDESNRGFSKEYDNSDIIIEGGNEDDTEFYNEEFIDFDSASDMNPNMDEYENNDILELGDDIETEAAVASVAGSKENKNIITNSEAAKSMLKDEEMNKATVVNYIYPPVSLLKENKNKGKNGDSDAELKKKADKLEAVLHSFNIDANVTKVTQGPTVTRYEVHPNSGVKVRGIKNLADDIALNMEAKSIRIEAPIPGKPAVGIEIENSKINMVTAREIIDSDAFKRAKSKITFAVGKDIAGNEIVADLKGMPHLLIAGSTGSGKSVCINSIITSIIYKARPEEVKLVLVDPKVVELANYNGIPHLLIPVVTDPAKAAAALNWAVAEMDERYRKFAAESTRELASYNEKMKAAGRADEVMPQVVIVIDELADLMMAAPSQVEDSICRLAQKARAAGMHLIVATQRPSVDVITGVIKANIPSRIAFAVSSQVDSRTILDMIGAEKLVGKGDMLFNPLGTGKPLRVQGAFISDDEVNAVIDFVKAQTEEPEYEENVIEKIERANASVSISEDKSSPDDELLADAIELVVQQQQASVSMLQRRFRIGYNRAARIVDMMEERQIVGPQDGSRPRQVLMTEEELIELNKATEDMDL